MKYSRNFYEIKSNEGVFEEIKREQEHVGYFKLPYQDVSNILSFCQNIKQKHIAIIGIGGSSLGTYAIYKFLKPKQNYDKRLHFFESTDPLDLKLKLEKLDLKDTMFLVISKSGTTIETISIFKYFSSLITIGSQNCIIISQNDSKLSEYAKANNIKTFDIPENVGGRFSVFSHAGLVPLAIVGVDIKALLEGCKEVNESFFNSGEYYELIFKKARFFIENKDKFNINVIFSYSSTLGAFNKWYVQLWGESLGKIDVNGSKQGFTPIGLIGPADQHSFLQLINEGKRDKTITFLKFKNLEDNKNNIKIPSSSIDKFLGLDYANDIKFQDLISQQCNSVIKSIDELKDIPYDLIEIEKVDEKNIAILMYFYQILTSVMGKFMQINTYDQPGVERGKSVLKEILKNKQLDK